MIPKKIHSCWFGPGKKNILIERCIESWRENLPEYEITIWTEENTSFDTDFLINMRKEKQWAFISDYIRMRALHLEGGIYLDTDIEVIKSLDPLLENDCFLGFEAKNRLNTAVLGARKNHPFLMRCMNIIDERHRNKLPYLIAPEVANAAYSGANTPTETTVYPTEYFYPYNPYDPERPTPVLMYKDITENTYTIHHWNKSWKSNRISSALKKLELKLRNTLNV